MEREREQQRIAMEAERLERERKRLEDMVKEKDEYIRKKAAFLNLVLTDGLIIVKVLQSVDEFYEEGKAMHHCVYTNAYYNDENSLILSARIDGERIETVEVDLQTLKVVQSRGVCNSTPNTTTVSSNWWRTMPSRYGSGWKRHDCMTT